MLALIKSYVLLTERLPLIGAPGPTQQPALCAPAGMMVVHFRLHGAGHRVVGASGRKDGSGIGSEVVEAWVEGVGLKVSGAWMWKAG